jgi:hypothetical protein
MKLVDSAQATEVADQGQLESMMSVLRIIIGGVILALGVLEGAQALRSLTMGDAKVRWLKTWTGAGKWRLLATSLLQVVVGAVLITGLIGTDWSTLALVLLSLTIVTRLVNSDLKSWRHSRQERKLADAAAGHVAVLTGFENSPFARRLRAAAEGWEALKDRQVNLDRRVESGEIAAHTRDRYLAAHRRQLIGHLGYNRLIRWPERRFVAALLPLLDAQARRSASRTD